jgi:hypothetical protein
LCGRLMLANMREQTEFGLGGFSMRGKSVVVSVGFALLAILLVPHLSEAANTALSALQGSYSDTGQGTFAACLLPPKYVEVPCSTNGAIPFPFSFADTGQVTVGPSGSACATGTAVASDLPPDASPPIIAVVHEVLTVTKYNPTTQTGDIASKAYTGGKCKGATFDPTGATLYNSFTYHFVVTDDGDRWDLVVTSWTDPQGGIGSFLATDKFLRQE